MKTKQPFIDEHHFSQETKNLKVKIDDLNLENQILRVEIEKLRTELDSLFYLPKFIQKYLNKLYQKTIEKLRNFKKTITTKLTFNKENEEKNYSSNFSPYQVKILHPLKQNRPIILHVIANFYTGGSSRLVVDLIEHLGHQFEQLIITRDYPEIEGYLGLNIYHYQLFKNSQDAVSILKKLKPDFIHVHYLGNHNDSYSELDWKWYNYLFEASKEYGCKIIENINIPTDPYVSNLVDFYVYVSDYVKREFGRLDSRNLTIYPGSDLSLFSRKNVDNIPDNCIGMVYRLEGDKLNENSIEVFIKVVQRRPETKALIVGGGYYLDSYKAKVQQAGIIDAFTFTGYLSYEELPAMYEKMSIFVAPIHTESFGQVSPFAMGMGIPVVSYDVGALKEIIGDSKLLASPGDSDTLASIIIDLLDNREKRLQIGISNHQRAQKLFSVEAMINSYSVLYEEMLKLP